MAVAVESARVYRVSSSEKSESWLVAWVGVTDHECAEAKRGSDLGPIATALRSEKRYDRIYLLTNYDFDRSKSYCTWSLYNSAA